MKILKLKAKFYQYTGIHLAKKEEAAYIETVKQKLKDSVYLGAMTNIMNEEFMRNEFRMEISLAIGTWQCNNGFVTSHNPYLSKKWLSSMRKQKIRHLYYSVVSFMYGFYSQLKMDLKRLVG